MPVCARSVLQQDGFQHLVLDPAVTDLSTCAYVVETGSSNAWMELGNMSLANAETIGAGVALVWCIAWTFRAIASSLLLSINERNNHE